MSIIRDIKVINKNFKSQNFYCQLCTYPLLTNKDFESNKTHECCNNCYMEFIEGRREEWKNGWRPEKTIIKDYILLRNKLNSKEIKWD
jgi:hypothetical protein